MGLDGQLQLPHQCIVQLVLSFNGWRTLEEKRAGSLSYPIFNNGKSESPQNRWCAVFFQVNNMTYLLHFCGYEGEKGARSIVLDSWHCGL
jgi:hypothetical protein